MNRLEPVYTEKTECQDCYKCVRHCPVKSIRIKENSAYVIKENCILCGKCVNVCPAGAKRIRSDLDRARGFLSSGKKVIVSLAPSFVTEFPGIAPESLIAAIKKLGFSSVSETALGAEIVNSACSSLLKDSPGNLFISSACPVAVDLIKKYYPKLAKNVTPLLSPVLAHCKMLRELYGDDVEVVFISPCIAKKMESDNSPDLLGASLTFEELRIWFDEEGINPEETAVDENEKFIPGRSARGAFYPMEGGMLRGIETDDDSVEFMTFSGLDNLRDAFEEISLMDKSKKVFIEALACPGGCINGPRSSTRKGTALKRLKINGYSFNRHYEDSLNNMNIEAAYKSMPVMMKPLSESDVEKALAKVGKFTADDELNCGGCGYDSCREFAEALIQDRAEPQMCVSYMRKLAMNKANALIKSVPSGVVIVDEDLQVVECNKRFVEIIGGDLKYIYKSIPGLEGAYLKKIVPFYDIFETVLETGEGPLEKRMRIEGRVVKLTVFPIERKRIVGGIVQDITDSSIEKEQIVLKAREVIRKNLATVQQIAYLLGENASESEVILNSIVKSFNAELAPEGEEYE